MRTKVADCHCSFGVACVSLVCGSQETVKGEGEGGVKARRQLLKRVWLEVDEDDSSSLDEGEVREILLRMGRPEKSIDMAAVMAVLDADGSGDVDFAGERHTL